MMSVNEVHRAGRWLAPVMALLLAMPAAWAQEQTPVDVWETLLKPKYFQDQPIQEGTSIIELKTPYRAEDAAIVPISVLAKIPQKPDLYIEKLYVLVDENPVPLAGIFTLTPEIGKADLAMRIRIDKYTNVRAVAQLSNGELHMTSNFVKAQGGCSAPAAGDLQAARERMGQMRFRTVGESAQEGLALGQLMISHPNLTGMQLDQRTRAIIPPDYVQHIVVKYNGKPIMTAEVDISISEDPSFRFFFVPQEAGGELTAEVVDSKGREFVGNFEVAI